MHEQSLINNLISRIESVAAEHGGARVSKVYVHLGALAHISPEHFREHFEYASCGTIAEGAGLDIECGDDPSEMNAQDIMLLSVEVET